ncbi:putative cyclin-A3-1 isoform X1 [Octopus sinensis]|uniref:Cyclin-A3-1 isoform X1 n=2 Tax=Octopus sinensis TaxID=2607531 RepID=A0A6P7S444_9MOLL|nr:putative cyclin-A3-1 isoform X1 [Octopus sinensis]XP_036356685.1 putative cyclin-A3-1 isoform X1 [Octopus sinensis]
MTTTRQLLSLRRMSEELEKLENKSQQKLIQRRHSTISYESSSTECSEQFETVFRDSVNVKHKVRLDICSDENYMRPDDGPVENYGNLECNCSSNKCKGLSLQISDFFTNKNLPPNVTDIDTGVTDFTNCGEYAQDIIQYLQEIEKKWVLKADFLRRQREVSCNSRGILIDWIINVQVHLKFCEETLMLTVKLIDVFLAVQNTPLDKLQLLGIACLFLASKFYQQDILKVSQLIYLTDNSYSKQQLLSTELFVLAVMNFELSIPTPIVFLGRFLLAELHKREVEDLCKYLMNLALVDHEFVVYRSSEITASALLLSRYVLKPNIKEAWTPGLTYYTGYKRFQLDSCVKKLATKLLDVEISEYQGPRHKFALQSKYGCISHHPALSATQPLRKATKGMLTYLC